MDADQIRQRVRGPAQRGEDPVAIEDLDLLRVGQVLPDPGVELVEGCRDGGELRPGAGELPQSGDPFALGLQGADLLVDPGEGRIQIVPRVRFRRSVEDLADGLQAHPRLRQPSDVHEAGEVVEAVVPGPPFGDGEQADAVVPAHRPHRRARQIGDLGDLHAPHHSM